MIDIVFPKNNEKEFIDIGVKLGHKEICFVYDFNVFAKIKRLTTKKIKINYGILANYKQLDRARKLCNLVLVKSSDNNRAVFEHSKPDIVFSLEDSKRGDFIYYRNSGLNQVFCKLAKRNEIIVGLSFDLILNSRNRPRLLGRIMQNIRLCKKYKVKAVLASFATKPGYMRNQKDLESLGKVLGMDTKQAKENSVIIKFRVKENKEEKSPDFIAKGAKLV
ncbi:hypothetical protein KY337_03620 [Candidatus Woesearchaeota archaeon]|nr:hypothetical protein [Candidatus Woesearchaeota archaeon]